MNPSPEYVERFGQLFRSNGRSFGQFDPDNGQMWAEKIGYTETNVEKHLAGVMGLGLVPILDDGTCYWAAIDIDAHEEGREIDLVALERKCRELDLPLTVCRSKSAGAHCYLFFAEAEPCLEAIKLLRIWSSALGYGGSEIFPKQSELIGDSGGEKPFGNWINLPHMGMDDTNRWAFEGGKRVSFDYFLSLAESRKVRIADIRSRVEEDHPDAPPCFQRMMMGVPGRGARNNAIYNATLYYKKSDPENVRTKVLEFNARALAYPLDEAEVTKTVKSALRREYSYKCYDAPINELCERDICFTRKHGISVADKSKSLPKLTNLRQHMTDPVYWEIDIDGKSVTCTTKTLMNWWLFSERVFEVTRIMPPSLKKPEWNQIINKLGEDAEKIYPPDDASTKGILIEKLLDFLQKANTEIDEEDRAKLLRGVPITLTITHKDTSTGRYIVFRMRDFVAFLKKQRFEEFKGAKLYMALNNIGLETQRIKIEGTAQTIWAMPVEAFDKKIGPIHRRLEY